ARTQEGSVPRLRTAVSREQPQIELLEAVPGTHLVPPAGTGLHHIGYYVDDLEAATEALTALDIPLVRGESWTVRPPSHGPTTRWRTAD
ncbi:VOC family protein, partial [Streptomyces sp. NPDC057690]|uniref:VOC family protein n=1 Tax=Streptomyces sp. NPDC057690 TaxID=3346214 RepID=UPI0036CB63A9